VALAVAVSCAVLLAGALGVLSTAVMVVALGLAGFIALLSYRDSELRAPVHVLTAFTVAEHSPLVIDAPRARDLPTATAASSDVA
jgi:hypothetical protein